MCTGLELKVSMESTIPEIASLWRRGSYMTVARLILYNGGNKDNRERLLGLYHMSNVKESRTLSHMLMAGNCGGRQRI